MNNLPVISDDYETKDQLRKRLAIELRAIAANWNSKLTEILETGIEVQTHMIGSSELDRNALIEHVDISYQTPAKFY